MTTVGLPDTSANTNIEPVSCLVVRSACAYGTRRFGCSNPFGPTQLRGAFRDGRRRLRSPLADPAATHHGTETPARRVATSCGAYPAHSLSHSRSSITLPMNWPSDRCMVRILPRTVVWRAVSPTARNGSGVSRADRQRFVGVVGEQGGGPDAERSGRRRRVRPPCFRWRSLRAGQPAPRPLSAQYGRSGETMRGWHGGSGNAGVGGG
jgi:hypothetical protein